MLLRSILSSLVLIQSTSTFSIQFPFLQQPGSSSPSDYPYRSLPWGEVNVIHTTDTHGWLMGHQREEPIYSGDFGDLYSFVTRMKKEAKRRGVDLLVVDSGDRVDGNGFVDGEPPGQVKGFTAMKFFQEMPYDVITTGNHELYKYPVALSTLENIAQYYGENYVTSNVNITIQNQSVPLGNRFRTFVTVQGRSVTAFGPIFDFKAHAPGTTVQSPSLMVLEPWFLAAIESPPDFFLLAGHMSIQKEADSQWSIIFKAIRARHPKIPILIFGGHHHIRDCKMEDERSMSLASGRYMETIGWMSVSGLKEEEEIKFDRRYLDQNRNTYKYHAGNNFDTKRGKEISRSMTVVAAGFNLTREFGIAPHSYYLYRYPPTSERSILNLMTSKVLPLLVDRPDLPSSHITILNTGSIRFDIFKGPFTRNDQWIILPFTNNFLHIKGVKRSTALQLLPYLNFVGEHGLLSPSIESIYHKSLLSSFNSYASSVKSKDPKLTWGYVTQDFCPGLGDDTLHKPLPAVEQPVFVSTLFPAPSSVLVEGEEEEMDVVFFDFIQVDILSALNFLQKEKVFSSDDVGLYVEELTANTIMQEYATREWN